MSADITTIVIEEHQLSETEAWLSLNELCERCGLEPPLLIELVDIGLITPSVVASDQWRFQTTAVPALHQALRLRRELELDWQGVAVAMDAPCFARAGMGGGLRESAKGGIFRPGCELR